MVNYEHSDLYFQGSVEKHLKIYVGAGTVINENQINIESMSLTETLCSDGQLTFGSCNASEFKIRVSNVFESLKGKWITVKETLEGYPEVFQFGRYKVISDTPTADRDWRDIVAYDAMYDILNADVGEWYNSLSFPMTLKAFRDSFVSHFGIAQESVELINDSMRVEKTLDFVENSEDTIGTTLSGKEIIEAICEINGVFGHINRKGELAYIELKSNSTALFPSNDLSPSDSLFPKDFAEESVNLSSVYLSGKYEDFITNTISKLCIRQESDDLGVTVGKQGNTYIIQNNFLVYGKSINDLTNIAKNTLSIISKAQYRPYSIEVIGNPCIEIGDPVRYNTTREVILSYVLERTLTGINALKDAFSATGVEEYTEQVNSTQKEVISLKKKANIFQKDIDHTMSALFDENGNSKIEQTASAIRLEVNSALNGKNGVYANLALKLDKNDDGTVVSLISGSANKISFNASNLFTVDSPNFKVDTNGKITCVDANIEGAVTTGKENGFSMYLDKSKLSIRKDNSEIGVLRYSTFNYSDKTGLHSMGDGIVMDVSGGQNLALGKNGYWYYLLNNGSDPNGHSQDHIFSGTALFENEITLNNKLYFSNDAYINTLTSGGLYVSDTVAINGHILVGNIKYNNYENSIEDSLYINGDSYVNGDFGINGKLTTTLEFSDGSYINYLTKGGLYLSNNTYIDGDLGFAGKILNRLEFSDGSYINYLTNGGHYFSGTIACQNHLLVGNTTVTGFDSVIYESLYIKGKTYINDELTFKAGNYFISFEEKTDGIYIVVWKSGYTNRTQIVRF